MKTCTITGYFNTAKWRCRVSKARRGLRAARRREPTARAQRQPRPGHGRPALPHALHL